MKDLLTVVLLNITLADNCTLAAFDKM